MSTRGSAGLPAALILLAVSTALGAAVLELAHTQTVLSRARRNAAAALATADGCLAAIVARLPAGWGFDEILAAFAAGTVPVGDDCGADARPAPDPARLLLAVEGTAGDGRRVVEAVVTRASSPGGDALLWWSRETAPEHVAGTLTLDGVDVDDPASPPVAAIAGPGDPTTLDAWIADQGGHVVLTVPDAAPRFAPPPPVAELDARAIAAGAAAGGTFVAAGPAPPALTRIATDLVVTGPLRGAGLLVVAGRLDIVSSFEFIGVVVAVDGVRVADGGRLAIQGELWIGPVDPADPALDVQGDLLVAASADGLALADGLLPLPRRARIGGVSDPG